MEQCITPGMGDTRHIHTPITACMHVTHPPARVSAPTPLATAGTGAMWGLDELQECRGAILEVGEGQPSKADYGCLYLFF